MSRTILSELALAAPDNPGWLNNACQVILFPKPGIVAPMKPTLPLIFWIVTFALVAATVVLLHHVLLPFVVAATLAYLLDPVVDRLERIGMNRASATLFITGLF